VLSEREPTRLVGADISPEMVKACQRALERWRLTGAPVYEPSIDDEPGFPGVVARNNSPAAAICQFTVRRARFRSNAPLTPTRDSSPARAS
jgi:hypothetical protein